MYSQQQFSAEVPPELLDLHSQTERVRSYPDRLMFWAFFNQVASDDSSCAAAVAQVQAWAEQESLAVPKGGTSSYCRARSDLPVEMLRVVNESIYSQLDAFLPRSAHWRGMRPRAEDGTSVQMPDTDSNRARYPYPCGQAEGCGLPMARLSGLIDLSHGGLKEFACSSMQTGELSNHNELEAHLQQGDVLIADRLYSGYEQIVRLWAKDVHFIGRVHHARKLDWNQGKKIGPNERLFTWKKPRTPSDGSKLNTQQWRELPDELTVRVIRCKGPDREGRQRTRHMVTTLLNPKAYPAEEVLSLYAHRWEIELRFRDIKSTLGMEMLRTKSPEMIEKELLMFQIVYNLMRLIMLKASIENPVNHRRISFRGTVQVVLAFRNNFRATAEHPRRLRQQRSAMFEALAERSITERPGRNEPRRVKRRPKCSKWLQKPRHQYFEHFRTDNPIVKILDQ